MKTVRARILDATHLELNQPLPETTDGRLELLITRGDNTEKTAPPVKVASGNGSPEKAVEPDPTRRTVAGSRLREREDAWCRSHPEVLRHYEGQWLVVEGEQVIAHGRDPARLVLDARAQGVRIPYIFYVEGPRPGVVRLGL